MAGRVEFDWRTHLEEGLRKRLAKASRPPLPLGLTKKDCRRRTIASLEALPVDAARAMHARMLKSRCFRCGRCSLAPQSI